MKLSDTPVIKSHADASPSALNVLLINASSRIHGSVTRYLTDRLVKELQQWQGISTLISRDLAVSPLGIIDEAWIAANFTDVENRDDKQRAALAESDELVSELKAADVIVLGVPVYNFSVPAALKAWIDLVARAGLTFRYTSDGPAGLLQGKKAIVAVASGGIQIDSVVDFTTPYMRHILGFIGIKDVEIVAAQRMNVDGDEGKRTAEQQITKIVSSLKRQQTHAA